MNFVAKIDIFNRYVVKKFTNTLHLPTFHLKYLRKKSFVFRWINWDGWLPKNVRLRKTKENLWNFKLHPFHFQVDWSNPQNLVPISNFSKLNSSAELFRYRYLRGRIRLKKGEKAKIVFWIQQQKKKSHLQTHQMLKLWREVVEQHFCRRWWPLEAWARSIFLCMCWLQISRV